MSRNSTDKRIYTILEEMQRSFTKKGNRFNGQRQLIETKSDGKLPVLDGSNLYNVIGTSAVEYIATDNISAYDVVTSDGQKADSSDITHRNKIIGIAKTGTLIGFSGFAQGTGEITNPAWTWVVGDRIYLNGTSLSTIAPLTGFIQQVGTAVASNKINIEVASSILL